MLHVLEPQSKGCVQIRGVEEKLLQLHAAANDVTQLLGFVSLNLAAMRKILKKAAKNLEMKSSYGSGVSSWLRCKEGDLWGCCLSDRASRAAC